MCGVGSPAQTTLLGSSDIGGSQGPIMSTPITIDTPSNPSGSAAARLALLTQGAGSVTSAAGAFAKASADQAAAKYNASLATAKAINDQTVGESTAQKLFGQTNQLKSTQRASFAARGLSLSTGSPLDILTSTDTLGGADQATLKTNTQMNVDADMAKAAYFKSQASNASPFISAGTSLISGAGKVADKWYDDKKAGLFANGFFGG